MNNKQTSVNKSTMISYRAFICCFMLAVCYLFVSCELPGNGNETPTARSLTFSHNSGLYDKSFKLTIKAPAGATIYYSTDGSIPLPSKAKSGGPVFKYSAPITVQNRSGQPVLATPTNSEQFYMKPGDPRGSGPDIFRPTSAQVPKVTVIRALAVVGGKQSEVLTRTYFLGNDLQRYGNHPVISIVTDPSNLIDRDKGIYVRGNSNNVWPNYNFNQKGRDWEREANLDFFDGSRRLAFSTGAGIRIRGGWSRDKGQKSFNVYFRDEYPGLNNLSNYPLIPGAIKAYPDQTQITRNKNFMLRNGGNDTEYTKFYDVFVQSLFRDRNFTTQAAVPCILYLNGEYWGPYNLQEKYSDHYLEQKFGVNRNNVIVIETGVLEEGVQSDMALYNNLMSFKDKDMSNSANYNDFCQLMDIQSYIDYYAAEIYVYNEDWPHNNFQLWRVRNVEPNNPYGDGKWRWMMYDTEFSMGIYSGGGTSDPFSPIMGGDHDNNKLFQQLLKNPDFRRQFVLTMMDLYNVNFEYNYVSAKLDEIASVYRPLMAHYFERWGGWSGDFQYKINAAKSYLSNIRSAMTNDYLPRYFGSLGTPVNVTLSAKDEDNGRTIFNASIKINTTTPSLTGGSWTGKYYTAYPVTVTANVPYGYTFTGWTVTGGAAATPSDTTTQVTLTSGATITANYDLTNGIHLSGNLTLPSIDPSIQHIKIILHNADRSWRSEVSLTPTVSPIPWTTKTPPFERSTQIFFQIEGYETQGSISSLFVLDSGVSRAVQSTNIDNIDINLSGTNLIKLSGTISLSPHPAGVTYIGMRVLANGKVLGQTAVSNSGSVSAWQMYVPAQTANTPVKWNFYGFNNAALWEQISPIISENRDIASCSSIYNQAKSGINMTNLSLIPPLSFTSSFYRNAPAAGSMTEQNGEYRVNVTTRGNNTWDAALCFDYGGKAGTGYRYSFYAKTETGTRDIYVQNYWDETNSSFGQNITMTNTYQQFTFERTLPATLYNTPSLQFQCAGQTGIFYVKDVSIVQY